MEDINEKLLKRGDKFSSFDELEERLAIHMEESCTIFWKRDVRTLRIAAKTIPRAATCNQDLHYYFVKYACNHGGKKFVSKKSVHSTRKSSTFKNGCGAFLLFILSDNGQSLILKTDNTIHNHPIPSRHIIKQYLRKRKARVSTREKDIPNAQELVNKKAVVKKPTPLENVKAASLVNSSHTIPREQLESERNIKICVQLLQLQYECNVDSLSGSDEDLKAIFFQDKTMKEAFDAFPEMLFVDGTFKVLKICATVCLFMVMNSAGVCDVVAVAVLYVDDNETRDWVVSTFKNRNRQWVATSTIFTDKNATQRAVFARHFPQATSLICRYHVTQSFRMDVNAKKLGITQAEEIVSKGFLQQIMDSPNERAYDSLHREIMEVLPEKVMSYFNSNWHEIRTQWVYGYSQKVCVFFDDFCCRVEAFCKRFNMQIRKFATVKQLLVDLFAQISIQRTECDNQAVTLLHTKTSIHYDPMSPMTKFCNHLTNFAFTLVEKQFKQTSHMKCVIEIIDERSFLFKSMDLGNVVATGATCECSFFAWLSLPCQHIFHVRQYLQIDLFDLDVRAKRWTREFYLTDKSLGVDRETDVVFGDSQPSAEKYSAMLELTNNVAVLGSQVGDQEFEERMQVVNDLLNAWKKGKKVQILELVEPEFFAEVELLENVPQEILVNPYEHANSITTNRAASES